MEQGPKSRGIPQFARGLFAALWNWLLGILSPGWFIVAVTCAFNIEQDPENELFVSFGWAALILLALLLVLSNGWLYRKAAGTPLRFLGVQVLPFLLGAGLGLYLLRA